MAETATQRETQTQFVSIEEYLSFEMTSPAKHEYVNGQLFAMVGVSRRHARIVLNIGSRLLAAAGDGSCEVYTNDVKLMVASTTVYYPDVIVACDEDDSDAYIVRQPCLVVEVLSPSTSGTDRREKLLAYRRIESLSEYLIVDQERRWIERHWRDDSRTWWHAEYLNAAVPVICLGMTLALDDIYRSIALPQGE